ncbi:ABC transporter ATP-binding protein [Bordetella avium]|uniref:ABC transporter, ATP-binding protein n=6 Tax=Bordetella avium TaxID=521 RepID=Q2KXJ5_BORA1|nr:ABC transporter ATP-binding protein [Bordetella avium]AZY48200.1 ABC transporter ATP-binding protein [Bordetella avium]AZY51580.1 ABC transporter ATP-binding protein [Bordetella avium]RIQ13556.1 ABC transporter ATP-binding protein [Bordetella avium]RIQ36903.1 ABC transporter ATP-binding protein [Bordetella avium]RIQ40632.1 ABC transporter ATP-binding protein [Bordetella avium]
MSSAPLFLQLRQLSYAYPGQPPVVDGIDWSLQTGRFHCLVGRSGCGKTTLLKLAAGLLAPQSGDILGAPRTRLGYVFQAPTLLDWLRVIDNVLLPVSLQGRPQPADQARAQALLALLGLAEHALRYPRQLSGGQQSRVALARALILNPDLLLLDEPFAALDAITREELQDDLLAICRQHHTTVLFITHDIGEAVYLGDRVAVMHKGRLAADIAVTLPTPRAPSMRHGAAFNQYCSQLYDAMRGAEA